MERAWEGATAGGGARERKQKQKTKVDKDRLCREGCHSEDAALKYDEDVTQCEKIY